MRFNASNTSAGDSSRTWNAGGHGTLETRAGSRPMEPSSLSPLITDAHSQTKLWFSLTKFAAYEQK